MSLIDDINHGRCCSECLESFKIDSHGRKVVCNKCYDQLKAEHAKMYGALRVIDIGVASSRTVARITLRKINAPAKGGDDE